MAPAAAVAAGMGAGGTGADGADGAGGGGGGAAGTGDGSLMLPCLHLAGGGAIPRLVDRGPPRVRSGRAAAPNQRAMNDPRHRVSYVYAVARPFHPVHLWAQ